MYVRHEKRLNTIGLLDMERRVEANGGKDGAHSRRLRVMNLEFDERTAYIRELLSWMGFDVPFDERGSSAAQRKATVWRDRD